MCAIGLREYIQHSASRNCKAREVPQHFVTSLNKFQVSATKPEKKEENVVLSSYLLNISLV